MEPTSAVSENLALLSREEAQARLLGLPPGNDDDASVIFRSCVLHQELMCRSRLPLPDGITRTQMSILTTLDTFGAMAMTPLSECVDVSKEQASRAVKPLLDRGLVEGQRNDRNRRVVVVRLTAAGQAFLQELMTLNLASLEKELAPLSPEERAELARLSRESGRLISKVLESRHNPFAVD